MTSLLNRADDASEALLFGFLLTVPVWLYLFWRGWREGRRNG